MGDRTAFRTCPLCEALCGLELTLDDAGKVTRVRGDAKDPFSKGFICPKGATLGSLDGDPDRLAEPLVKGQAAGWEEAFADVREGLAGVIERYGRDAVAVYIGNPTAHSIAGPLYGTAIVKALTPGTCSRPAPPTRCRSTCHAGTCSATPSRSPCRTSTGRGIC